MYEPALAKLPKDAVGDDAPRRCGKALVREQECLKLGAAERAEGSKESERLPRAQPGTPSGSSPRQNRVRRAVIIASRRYSQ
jgi:hypothetical protein